MDSLLQDLTESIAGNSLEAQVRALIQLLQQSTGLESAYFTRIDLTKGVQQIVYSLNTGQLQLSEGLSVDWNDTLCKRAIEQNQFVTSDVSACWADSAAAAELGINTYISAPVQLSDGLLYGTVCAASTEKTPVSTSNATLLQLISRLIAIQVEREQLMQQLAQENRQFRNVALTDPLTGLGNRRALELELKRALANSQRNGTAVFVAYIDLDNLGLKIEQLHNFILSTNFKNYYFNNVSRKAEMYFHNKTQTFEITLNSDEGKWLTATLEQLSVYKGNKITYAELKSNFEQNFQDFELFWYSKPIQNLRNHSLVVL